MDRLYDVIVIGGGPAGSTAATFLAQKGWRVIILERKRFPRYSVGESMLPFCYFPLQRIGVIDQIKNSPFTQKHSVQFVRKDSESSLPFYFADHMDHDAATTWQVERGDFDLILLDHARNNGVKVFESTAVKEFIKDEHNRVVGVQAQENGQNAREFYAPMVVDATGQYSFSTSRNGWRIKDRQLRKIAIWTYYKGAERDSGLDEGATTIAYLEQKNWIWYIPLQNRVSVGVVGDKEYLYTNTREPSQILDREIRRNLWVKGHLRLARKIEGYRVTGDISYRSRYCAADGLILVGDAFAFLDPVFSSGLFLALYSAVLAGEAVDHALNSGDYRATQFIDYGSKLCEAIEIMRKLVYAFYDPNFSFASVIKKYPHLKGDLTDCLVGNLHRDFSGLFASLGEFTNLPDRLKHGHPLLIRD